MMETLRRLLMGLALAGYLPGCGVKPPPDPVPPTPPPPEPQCVEGQTHSCWHFPPDSRTWLYACPVYDANGGVVGVIDVVGGPAQCPAAPPPPPSCPQCPEGQECKDPAVGCVPKPIPPPTTGCNPTLDPAKSAPVGSDSEWPAAADQSLPSEWKQGVWNGVRAAQASCPSAWSGDCLSAGPSGINDGYRLISAALQAAGTKASHAVVDGQLKDHLWIERSSGSKDWNASKLFYYGNGCLITGDGAFTVHGWYTYTGSGGTAPPDPPSTDGCSAPLPPKVWTPETLPDGWGSDQIGQPRWELGCTPHGNVVDCTPKVSPHACDYCTAIGMGEMGGQPRCGCPVRNECPGFKCEERVACEQYLTGGTKLESRNGASCSFAHNNPLQFFPNNGNCRLCSVGDGRVCGGWY
jgi:hypothetical protein